MVVVVGAAVGLAHAAIWGTFDIDAFEWPLLDWMRYLVSTHVVRVFVGSLFRATPVWTWYVRMNGARLGRGVYMNSLAVTDHSQLELATGSSWVTGRTCRATRSRRAC